MMKFAINTLGCKVNTFESASICEKMKNKGYQEVDFNDVADAYIIFTCAVTNTAESKSRKAIHKALRNNENALICVVGCYVQIQPEVLMNDQKIDILVGSNHKAEIPELIEKGLKNKERIIKIDQKDFKFEDLSLHSFTHQTRAYLKIQDGCNQYCSYCIIPYARGQERSLNYDDAISQAKELSEKHSEIVLTGIHTGRYNDGTHDLCDLIEGILENAPKLKRIRISSIEITEVNNRLISIIKNNEKVAKHLHIPLQAGSNHILKLMNRPYTIEEFKERLDYIRNEINEISISTDLIVGFPEESDDDFNNTLDSLNNCEFSFIHCFPYARKVGTKADKMENHVKEEIKKNRVEKVLKLSNELYTKYKKQFINCDVDVLVESIKDNTSFGHSSEYLPVLIQGKKTKNNVVKCTCVAIENDQMIAQDVKG